MGDGTRENPYTRDDLLKMVYELRSKGEIPNFSKKEFEEGIDLSGCDLKEVIFEEAIFPTDFSRDPSEVPNLAGAHLEKSDFSRAHLERADLSNTCLEGAILWHAHLEEAILWDTHLEGANLVGAHLEGVNLIRTKLSSDVDLEDVDWGNYILGEEKTRYFDSAVASYRHLKVWYTNAGYHDTASKFYFREKEAGRKSAKRLLDRFIGWCSWAVFGHGEGWKRILIWIGAFILLFALIYYFFGVLCPNSFLDCIYYSGASFIALGYGSWVNHVAGWAKGIGIVETFFGFMLMTLLLTTFVRKWTR